MMTFTEQMQLLSTGKPIIGIVNTSQVKDIVARKGGMVRNIDTTTKDSKNWTTEEQATKAKKRAVELKKEHGELPVTVTKVTTKGKRLTRAAAIATVSEQVAAIDRKISGERIVHAVTTVTTPEIKKANSREIYMQLGNNYISSRTFKDTTQAMEDLEFLRSVLVEYGFNECLVNIIKCSPDNIKKS